MKKTVITAAITFATLVLFVITGCKKETPVIKLESTFFAENTEIEYQDGSNINYSFFLSVPTNEDINQYWFMANQNLNSKEFRTLQVPEITCKLDGKAVEVAPNLIFGRYVLEKESIIAPIYVTGIKNLPLGKHQIYLSCSAKWQTLDIEESKIYNIFGKNTIDFEVVPQYRFGYSLNKPFSVGEVRTVNMDSLPHDNDWYVSVDNNDIIKIITQFGSNVVQIEAVAQGRASLYYHSNGLIKEVKIDVL